MKRSLFIILFLSLSANIFCQADLYQQRKYWINATVENVSLVNTPAEEFSPYIWSDYLIYVAPQDKSGLFKNRQADYFDLKASLLKDSVTLPNFIFTPELNSKYHEGPISWDQSKNKLYFTRANSINDLAIIDEFGRQLLQIYQADYAQGKWGNISKMTFSSDTVNYCHPAIFANGTKMILASSKPGGRGKMDLCISKKEANGNWSEPTNLGEEINQVGNQWFPFVLDDTHLFYASDVGDGQGLDLYYAVLEGEEITQKPQRLPFPINTSYDDFGLVFSMDKTKAYLSSNRPEGKGKDDIYEVIFNNNSALELNDSPTSSLIPTPKETTVNSSAPPITQLETPETKSIPVPANSTQVGDQSGCQISIQDKTAGRSLGKAELTIYVLPEEIASNFQYQVESFSSVDLLEIMASNVSLKKEYIIDESGKISINFPKDTYLYLVVKKDQYQTIGRYISRTEQLKILNLKMEKSK